MAPHTGWLAAAAVLLTLLAAAGPAAAAERFLVEYEPGAEQQVRRGWCWLLGGRGVASCSGSC